MTCCDIHCYNDMNANEWDRWSCHNKCQILYLLKIHTDSFSTTFWTFHSVVKLLLLQRKSIGMLIQHKLQNAGYDSELIECDIEKLFTIRCLLNSISFHCLPNKNESEFGFGNEFSIEQKRIYIKSWKQVKNFIFWWKTRWWKVGNKPITLDGGEQLKSEK